MTNPLDSIMALTFNRAHLIGKTLDYALAQTYQNRECLVIKRSKQGEIITVYYKLKLKGLGMKRFFSLTTDLAFHKNPLKAGAFFMSMVLNSYFNKGFQLFKYSRS